MSTPFVCNCGHAYLPTLKVSRLQETFSTTLTTDDSINAFLKGLNVNHKASYYYPKNVQYEQYTNPLIRFISLRKALYKGGNAAFQIKARAETNLNIINQQRAVFKSIARQIRKEFLKTHRRCLKEMKHGILRKGVCCYALAYLNWRRDIEGDFNYLDVDRGIRKNVRGSHTSSFYTHIHEGLLDEMVTWVNQIAKGGKNDLHTVQWALDRMYPLLMWRHFHLWTHNVESLLKKENEWMLVEALPFPRRTNFPLCLYSFNEEQQQLSFQRDEFDIKFKNKLYCYKNKTAQK